MSETVPSNFRDMASRAEFLAHAVMLEEEAAIRFDELAEALATHNNAEGVVDLFQKMSHYSRLHLADARQRASSLTLPDLKPWDFKWPDAESPESADISEIHYRMTPWHALQLALVSEERGHAFYATLAAHAADPDVRTAAAEFAEEEAEHVALLKEWIDRTPPPPEGWEDDMDPPVSVD